MSKLYIDNQELTAILPFEYLMSKRDLLNFRHVSMVGYNGDLDTGVEESIVDQGGIYTYLTSDTTLYVSSSSAADVGQVIQAAGLKADYTRTSASATLNGQNQVALSADFFRLFIAQVFTGSAPQGDIYIAESDTLTGGVPDTTSKIKGKIIVGDNITRLGLYTVPAGKKALPIAVRAWVGQGKEVDFRFMSRLEQAEVFRALFRFTTFQNNFQMTGTTANFFFEKSDIEIRGIATGNNTAVNCFIEWVEIVDEDQSTAQL